MNVFIRFFYFRLLLALLSSFPVVAEVEAAAIKTTVKATLVDHKSAYTPKPERGPHIDVKITPPEIRGREGRVMIEVYNRGKIHLASVTFDVTLLNQGGFELTAPVTAEDLKPNLSGGQWVKIPQIKGIFPKIIGAKLTNMRAISVEAKEQQLPTYLDLIKY